MNGYSCEEILKLYIESKMKLLSNMSSPEIQTCPQIKIIPTVKIKNPPCGREESDFLVERHTAAQAEIAAPGVVVFFCG